MKYYLVYHCNFFWSLLCTNDIKNCSFLEEYFYEEISYEEFIQNIDFCRGNVNDK